MRIDFTLLLGSLFVIGCSSSESSPGTDSGAPLEETAVVPADGGDETAADGASGDVGDATLGDVSVDGTAGDGSPGETGPSDSTIVADDPTSTLWFYGNFADASRALGRHDLATKKTTTLRTSIGSFDLSKDGSVAAFTASVFLNGREDVWVMNGDGTGAHPVAVMSKLGKATTVRVSPDGSRIGFIADRNDDGSRDVYVVPTAGGAAVKVSPAGGGQPDSIRWAPDGKRLGFVGAYASVDAHQIWLVDTTASTPTPKPLLSETDVGTGSSSAWAGADPALPIEFASGNRVVFRGRMQVDAKPFLYAVGLDGSGLGKLAGPTANVSTFGLSSDGATIAFASDAMVSSAFEVYVMPSTGSATPQRVTSGFVAAGQGPLPTLPLSFSPDGANLAFVANIGTGDLHEPFVVSSKPGGPTRRLAKMPNDGVTALAWSPEGKQVAVLADVDAYDSHALFRLDATLTDQTPVPVVAATELTEVRWSMASKTEPFAADAGYDVGYSDAVATDGAITGTSHMWFMSDWLYDSNPILARYDHPTGTTTKLLDETIEFETFVVSKNGARIAFVAEVAGPGLFDLWTMKPDASGLTKLATGSAAYSFHDLAISSDGAKVAYTRDGEAYVIATAGGAPSKVTTGLLAGRARFAFSDDSTKLAIVSDPIDFGLAQLYVVDLTATPPTTTTPVPLADWTSDGFPMPGGGTTKYGGPTSAATWSGAKEVLLQAHHSTKGDGFFRVAIDSASPTRITGAPTTGRYQFTVSPDHKTLAYAQTDGSTGLWMLPVAGGTPARIATSYYTTFAGLVWKPDSTALAYFAAPTFGGMSAFLSPVSTTNDPPQTSLTSIPSDVLSSFTWSPDGSALAYILRLGFKSEVYRIDVTGTAHAPQLVHSSSRTTGYVTDLTWTP